MSSILTFQETEFDVVDIHNVPWLRGSQVASALGYSDPSRSIAEIHARNADEFTADMTQVVELPTAGGPQQVRIFSPRGCYLLGMLARTERAKAFRQWVLDVLEGRVLPHESKPLTVPQQISLHKLRLALLDRLAATTAPGPRVAIHQQLRHASQLLRLPCPAIDTIGRTLLQPELPGV